MENFDRSKVIVGALKAGAINAEAEKLASQIEAWLPTVATNGVVKSQDIRIKDLQLLSKINPKVGNSFEFYRKPS